MSFSTPVKPLADSGISKRVKLCRGGVAALLFGALLTVNLAAQSPSPPDSKNHLPLTSGQKLQWNHLQVLTKEFNNRENADAREHAARSYLQGSRGLRDLFHNNVEFWRGRARAALILAQKDAGVEAGSRLLALAPDEPTLAGIFKQLRDLGWTEQSQAGKSGDNFVVPPLSLPMIYVPAGSFAMGAPEASTGHAANEGPVTQVALSKPFWMGRHEITVRQWKTVMREDMPETMSVSGNVPVVDVTWDEAMEFCRRLTLFEKVRGGLPAGYAYTLPTEAQWEYAARAGAAGLPENDLDAHAWYHANSGARLHPVGEKKPNAWGLANMQGNASEWCYDWYAERLPGGSVSDPRGPASGELRVVRGGNFNSFAEQCQPTKRTGAHPEPLKGVGDKIGFRVVLSPVIE